MTTVQEVGIVVPPGKGRSVVSEARHTVVILFEHALLGEGIATYLHAQTGVQATLCSAKDPQAFNAALDLGPEVVIFESNDPVQQLDLSTRVPHAVLIDVSTVITRGSALPPAAGLEQILQAVRERNSTDTWPAEASRVGTPASPAR